MTRGRGSHNVVARVPQRLQLFSVIAAVVAVGGGCGGGGFFCLAKDIARVDVCRCVCVVLDRRNHFKDTSASTSFFEMRFPLKDSLVPIQIHRLSPHQHTHTLSLSHSWLKNDEHPQQQQLPRHNAGYNRYELQQH